MTTTSSVQLSRDGLIVNGQLEPLYSGTVHYWRLDPVLWAAILQNVYDLGFRMIETYIPWTVHEIAVGQFDFGQQDPYKDLPRFLQLCQQIGISVCVRPGPHINAELTWFGFPVRVLENPAVWAYTANGSPAIADRLPQPFVIPSYASETFFAETGRFFDVLCPVLTPYLAPHGPIVACQVDNEMCYFFRTQLYDLDYSDDSMRLYRRMLAEKYGTVQQLNDAYRAHFAAFADVPPPREFNAKTAADLPYHLDWAAYKEYQINTALNRLGAMLRERGITTVPLYHDVAYSISTPIDITTMQAQPNLDFVGTNLYANQEEYAHTLARRVRYQVGTQKLPFVPEYGAGLWWFHSRTHTPAEEEFTILSGLMHGLKALNFYMLVERDRWQGSPITHHNTLRPGYADFFARLSDLVRRLKLLETEKLAKVLVLQNFDLNRYEAVADTLQDAYLGLLGVPWSLGRGSADFGFVHAPETQGSVYQPHSWLTHMTARLEEEQVEYDLGDTHLSVAQLARYPLVFVPTADFMTAADQTRLLEYVANGGHLVFGPGAPTLNELMQPHVGFGAVIDKAGQVPHGAGILTLLPKPSDYAADALIPYANPVCLNNPSLRLTIRASQYHRLCFVANPTNQPQATTLETTDHLRGLWNAAGDYAGETIEMAPYTINIWECLP